MRSCSDRLSLEIYQGETRASTFVTEDKQQLSMVLSEYRRLKETAIKDSPDLTTYSWLEPYSFRPSSWLSVRPPRDLRQTRLPLQTRLSRGSAGMPGNDTADFVTIRDDWTHARAREMACKTTEKTKLRQWSIRVGTFNVNGKLPSQDLSAWVGGRFVLSGDSKKGEWEKLIPPLKEVSPLSLGEVAREPLDTESVDKNNKTTVASPIDVNPEASPAEEMAVPDLYVFAFQELDLSTEALLYSSKTVREEAWTTAVIAALGEKGELYEKVGHFLVPFYDFQIALTRQKRSSRALFGTQNECGGSGYHGPDGAHPFVACPASHSDLTLNVKQIQGNKGAVSIRLQYYPPSTTDTPSPLPTALTFVNSHLAALDEMMDRRNADFHDITRRLAFSPISQYVTPARENGGVLKVFESDMLIWMGDLNYRINLPDDDLRTLLATGSAVDSDSVLLPFDQLTYSIRTRRAFDGFTEHPIRFLPTYRFNTGILTDGLGYDIKRKPAWTDRILHMASSFISATQMAYSSHPQIKMSDHKPVSADFSVEMPIIDCMALDSSANELYESLENINLEDLDGIPTLKLDNPSLEFGKVSYEHTAIRKSTLQNTGKVPCAFRFYSRNLLGPAYPDWLHVEPMAGFLLPSETIDINFTVFVSRSSAPQLNVRAESLQTIVILHTVLGKDHFISLSGQYESTCFGNPLSVLARLPGPIRSLQSADELLQETQHLNAPREIMRLINWLMSNDVEKIDDLFLTPGDDKLSLDTTADISSPANAATEAFAHAVATVLLALLDSLPEPVIPFSLHARCAEVSSRDEAFEVPAIVQESSLILTDTSESDAQYITGSIGQPFLHYLCAQDPNSDINTGDPDDSGPPRATRAEQLTVVFSRVLLRDDPEAAIPVSPLAKRRFLSFFISQF
ncbi:hypothetical protein EW146_g123 [Bondarzewia mesenterica]|uniref:Rho-GAP domain-containing protein n=1 Tax=Bondarzewia mesenterica TaxID=1095465 RepID=A0A4S4M7W1_9AGAM|nr:hypothetical protein EW146_g123 [Bondarzewia mesenterica]